MTGRQKALRIFTTALEAVQPERLLKQHISISPDLIRICGEELYLDRIQHIYIIGAGKASAAMARAIENILDAQIYKGLVVTKYHHTMPTTRIKITEAAHPVPDEHCVLAVKETLKLLKEATINDVIICLISGGASALWCDVPEDLTLQDIQTTFDLLIRSGASIHEINAVRKHLSEIKGGQLIRHCNGARVFTLMISDVPGDDPAVIASGPTVADHSTFKDALDVLVKYNLMTAVPAGIKAYIENGANGNCEETPKPGDAIFQNTTNLIIGNNHMALEAAVRMSENLGYHAQIVQDLITGNAEEGAKNLLARTYAYTGKKPVCIIQGGETTVNVSGGGKGGRNQHFVLAALKELQCLHDEYLKNHITILSGGTDGTDGPTQAAGGLADCETIQLAAQKNLSVDTYLHNHDSYHFLMQTQSLLITGPTQTNVMDIMMVLLE